MDLNKIEQIINKIEQILKMANSNDYQSMQNIENSSDNTTDDFEKFNAPSPVAIEDEDISDIQDSDFSEIEIDDNEDIPIDIEDDDSDDSAYIEIEDDGDNDIPIDIEDDDEQNEEDLIDEMNTTSNIAGYDSPKAFSKKPKKFEQAGYRFSPPSKNIKNRRLFVPMNSIKRTRPLGESVLLNEINFQQCKWQGIDKDLETSLEEYNFVVCQPAEKDYSDEWFVIHKIDDNSYGYSWIRNSELDNLIDGNDWADDSEVNRMLDFAGFGVTTPNPKKHWKNQNFVNKLSDCMNYWGAENILGPEYYPWNKKQTFQNIGLTLEENIFIRSKKNKVLKQFLNEIHNSKNI